MDTTTNSANVAMDSNVERIRASRSNDRDAISTVMKKVKAGYFGTATDKALDTAMDDLFDDFLDVMDAAAAPPEDAGHLGRQAEGYVLLCLGLSGTRKTSTISRMIRKRPEFEGFSLVPEENTSPLISVKAPSPCTLRLLGIEIATAMGYKPKPSIEENAVWALIRDNLANRRLRFIHIDEMQHVIKSKNVNEIGKIQDTIKGLAQASTWPVWLILSGLPEIGRLIEGDTQVWRRVGHVRFHTISFEKDLVLCRNMVKFFAETKAGIDVSAVITDEQIHRLIHASINRLGIAIDLVHKAIKVALKTKSKELLPVHFASGFERLSGCSEDGLNPFLAAGNFTAINVGQFFTEMLDDEGARAAKMKRSS